jgi:hypothetical protein
MAKNLREIVPSGQRLIDTEARKLENAKLANQARIGEDKLDGGDDTVERAGLEAASDVTTATDSSDDNGTDQVQAAPTNGGGNGKEPPITAAPAPAQEPVKPTTLADAIKVSGEAKSVFANLASLTVTGGVFKQNLVSRNVPIRKPGALEYFRTNPLQAFETVVVEDKENREIYFALPAAYGALAAQGLVKTKRLVRVITRQGVNLVWPIGIETDGRLNSWYESARDAELRAHTAWTRIVSNMPTKAYDIYAQDDPCDEPDWTSQSFEEILEIAFKGRIIDTPDHRIVRNWLGVQVA